MRGSRNFFRGWGAVGWVFFCGPGVRGLCSGILLNEFLEEKKTEKSFYDH